MKYCCAMLTQLQLPCSMEILFAMLTRMQFPCSMKCSCHVLMHCTSIGHVGMQMPMSIKKCYVVAISTEMQLPCLLKCNCHVCWKCNCHVYSTVYAMFNKNAVAMFYAMCFHWGNIGVEMTMANWKCSTVAMSSVLQLPCLLYCSCHVWCTTIAMFSVL